MDTPKIKERLAQLKSKLSVLGSNESQLMVETMSYMEDLCDNLASVEDAIDFPEENLTRIPQSVFWPFFESVKQFLSGGPGVHMLLSNMLREANFSQQQCDEVYGQIIQLMGIQLVQGNFNDVQAFLMEMTPEEHEQYVREMQEKALQG